MASSQQPNKVVEKIGEKTIDVVPTQQEIGTAALGITSTDSSCPKAGG
jgi:hypothetical protein